MALHKIKASDETAGVPNGGTTGQRLTKLSNTDGDVAWQALPTPTPVTLATLGIARGTATCTITGGTDALTATIPHGLTGTPATVTATARVTGDGRDDYIVTVGSRNATTLQFAVRAGAAEQFALANPTVVTFDWIAIA